MTKLFTPLSVGRMQLTNRLALPPMTRLRADDTHTPLPIMKDYYSQRASEPGTLLITEGTFIAPQAGGIPNVPGIWNSAQIAAWKEITDAVHAQGSYIYVQLWALGRAADPGVLKAENAEFEVVSASATKLTAEHAAAHALSESEIREYIDLYAQAARNAVAAGFDGVEIHGANGYLIDQFSQDMTNTRTDSWGGSIENRSRFALEVTHAVSEAIGADRTAIRFSPWSTFQGMRMADPEGQFSYLAQKMAELKLAFVHLVEPRICGAGDAEGVSETESLDFFLRAYAGASPVVIAGGYQSDSAREAVDTKYKDYEVVIGIGRPWTANPDLPFRIKNGVPLVPYQREFFYIPKDPKGYVDYEFSKEFEAAKVAAAAAA
ncbi:NADH:flavin oxidoreductase/NADH oxidase family protein [Penicillium lagena]|uniref:NADH:flavin oxidoreductase/NADH oxidase family protein n=1 Tax=Penicillium lagena TaxID=94218 RepID=UPI00254219DA|nr:NADH:flavin oxidoreductase/NADH oxidase family protein [Penicillium lagena]KAJ5602000.1 NADH:flavin oxidoreductase/NADH oxidase family protein [Penicillium lagena]